jgi:hypothetical protein
VRQMHHVIPSMFRTASLFASLLLVSGCVTTVASPTAGMSRAEKVEAGRRVSVIPAPVSTLEFKELGDSRRYSVTRTLISETWRDDCKPLTCAT